MGNERREEKDDKGRCGQTDTQVVSEGWTLLEERRERAWITERKTGKRCEEERTWERNKMNRQVGREGKG